MINEHINEFATDAGLTQIASYFNVVDNAIKTGDTNKRYTISSNASTAPSCPFPLGSWTSFVISPQGDNMCDLYNSYLTVDIDLGKFDGTIATLTSQAKTDGFNSPGYWIGFKDSMDCIEQYQILANGQAVYTQSNAVEESYITHMASTEAVKRVDVFSKAIHKDAWNGKDTCRTGIIVNADNKEIDDGNTHVIHLKIDIRRFLPFAAIKYLPEFVGNFELRIKFGISGLVCTPLSHKYVCDNPSNFHKAILNRPITNKFVPFTELVNGEVTGITGFSYDSSTKIATLTAGKQSSINIVNVPQIKNCFSHLACFGLDDNLYQQLIQRYMNESLSFPIQTLTFNYMNGNLGDQKTNTDFALTATPRFVDSIFVLFPKSNTFKTCYENPLFESFVLKMGGYGNIPEIAYSTTSPEFYELSSNTFNTNNDLTGFNKDVMKSLINQTNSKVGYESKDISNFVLSFPTSTDNTFQQGQTSNTPITYQLKVKIDENSPYFNTPTCNPIMGFLKDSVFAIQLKSNGPPLVSIEEYDITSPQG